MSDSTLRQQKENLIHLVGDGWLTEAYDLNDGEKLLDLIERCESDIRIELEALCQEVAREARLDELDGMQTYRHYGMDYQDSLDALAEYKEKRQAELTQKPAEETEGQ